MLLGPERPTIVFDIDGLVNIPEFKKLVYDPLRESGKFALGFWSSVGIPNPITRPDSRILSAGIHEMDFCLGGVADEFARIAWNLEDGSITVELADQEIRKNIRIISSSVGRRTLSKKMEGEVYGRVNEWFRLGRLMVNKFLDPRSYLKYPPLLTSAPSLLVESDLVCVYKEGDVNIINAEVGNTPRGNAEIRQFAEISGHSLVFTPEYTGFQPHPYFFPNVGDRTFSITDHYFQTPDVCNYLRDILLSWNGEHCIRDLGEEMGIYPYFRKLGSQS